MRIIRHDLARLALINQNFETISTMFRSALICTDFSDGLHRLVNFVPDLAASGIQKLVFFHNAPLLTEREIPRVDEDAVQAAQERLAPALDQVPDGLDVKVEIQSGRVTDNILRLAKQYHTDIIFLGMPSRNLLSERLFGSTTMELAQRCTTPLITLRPQLVSTYTTEELALRCRHLFRYFLLPHDGSEPAKYLVNTVKQHYTNHPQPTLERCLLYRVISQAGRRELRLENQVETAQAELDQVKADLESVGISAAAKVVEGDPIAEILKAAEEYDISAIAAASDGLGNQFVQSFTGEVLRQSWHPVIYMPPGRD